MSSELVRISESDRVELLRKSLEHADIESLTDMLTGASRDLSEVMRDAEPLRNTIAVCRDVLRERMLKDNIEILPHPELEIRLESKKENVVYINELLELNKVRIGGHPIPEIELRQALWEEVIPEQHVWKKHVTRLQALAKKYGSAVRDIVNRGVVVTHGPPQLTIRPKEGQKELQ